MIPITFDEKKKIDEQLKKNKVVIMSRRKHSRGRSFLVMESDIPTLLVLAKIRNTTKDKLLDQWFIENGFGSRNSPDYGY